MTETFPPSQDILSHVAVTEDQYDVMYKESIDDPEKFWGRMAKRLDWFIKPTIIKNASFKDDVSIRWYEDGILNACYNCVDRHIKTKAKSTALIWEGDTPGQDKRITYSELKDEVCRLANLLKERGVKKGDRVTIYMPMVPEAVYSMLACARIGAVHSVVFGGFSPDSL
ncbi:MAG TPA: acetyl-coenzyme A synthetase, partial [Rhodospirillaceae bacterium]|nr:acetyl-coenzyme A synthetase [Rhodospirillaceae bacterium]